MLQLCEEPRPSWRNDVIGVLIRTRRVETAERAAAPESEGGPERDEEVMPRIGLDGESGDGGLGDGDSDGLGEASPGMGAIIWLVASGLTVGLGALLVNLFRGAIDIRWSNLGTSSVAGDGEDTITLSSGPSPAPGAYLVTLEVPTFMTWWKAAELYDRHGQLRGTAWTKDEKKNSQFIVPASEVAGGFLVLKKAKAFGVHTAMYVIHDRPFAPGESNQLSLMAGRNVVLTWAAARNES
jgi:hypothetical protein